MEYTNRQDGYTQIDSSNQLEAQKTTGELSYRPSADSSKQYES